jgi:hypothetical protein
MNFINVITSIINQHGESVESDFYVDVDAEGDVMMDLSIKRHKEYQNAYSILVRLLN